MSEHEETIRLANGILERPYADPDDDLAMLSRQFLRALEVIESNRKCNDDMEKAMLAAETRCTRLEAALREVSDSWDGSHAQMAAAILRLRLLRG